MKRLISIFCLLSFLFVHYPALATVNVPTNTSVFIKPVETFTSKQLNQGEINATIQDNVVINNTVVFKAGDKATLTVSEIQKARYWGKPGKLTITNGWAYDTKGQKHKILFSQSYVGEEKEWPKVVGIVSIFFLWPLALFGFVHGEQAQVLSTKEIETYLASEFKF